MSRLATRLDRLERASGAGRPPPGFIVVLEDGETKDEAVRRVCGPEGPPPDARLVLISIVDVKEPGHERQS